MILTPLFNLLIWLHRATELRAVDERADQREEKIDAMKRRLDWLKAERHRVARD